MIRKVYTILSLFMAVFIFAPSSLNAQVQEGVLIGNWQDPSLPEMFYGIYNEVWGVVVNGVEYGVIGSTMGTHFIGLEPDVDGNLPQVAFVPGAAQGSQIIHRDFHSYGNYLYAVADEGQSTLQIIDFSGLPNSVSLVYDSDEFIVRSHNIFIDEPNARLYSTGGGVVLSLDDPENPVLLDNGFFGGHDVFVRDHFLIVNNGNPGMRFIDYTDYNNPVEIGSFSNYENGGYNHSGWLSEDGNHYFLCDETGGSLVKSLDISDLNNIHIVDMFKADNENPNHIAHNAILRDNLLYVSYYSDGIQIFDVTDPTQVVRKYWYDTYPGINDSGFNGAWGVYPLLPSGRVLVSDMASGFYLLDFPDDLSVFSGESSYSGCTGLDMSIDVLVGSDFNTSGVNLSATGLPSGASINFSENPAMPGTMVEAMISGLADASNFNLEVTADDGDASSSTSIPVEVTPSPEPLELFSPADGSTTTDLSPAFGWATSPGMDKVFEVSTYPDFSEADVISIALSGNTYFMPFDLEQNTTYYWRVLILDDCGEISSDIFSFNTAGIVGIEDLIENAVSIFPNPVQDEITIETGNYFNEQLDIELFDINGKRVAAWNFENTPQQINLAPPAGLQGFNLLRLSDAEHTLTRKVFFGK